MRGISAVRRGIVTLGLAGALLGTTALQAPAAHAEPIGLLPNNVTCGRITCTAYWSVDRTHEMHAEWKDTLVGAGSVVAAGAGVGAAGAAGAAGAGVVSGPVGLVAGVLAAGIGLAVAARSVEFNHMINGAAGDNRCLIYKFPKKLDDPRALGLGWFGSVRKSEEINGRKVGNDNCAQGPV